MIIPLNCGGRIVINQCVWGPGAFVATGPALGSQGVILEPDTLDQAIEELIRIRDAIASRSQPKEEAA